MKESDFDAKELQSTDHDYKILKRCRKTKVFPKIYWRGIRKGKMYTIEELVGPSLQEIFSKYQNHQFSRCTVGLIGIHVLHKLRKLHKAGVTHNSLTPSKILLSSKIIENGMYLVGLRDARKIIKHSQLLENAQLNEKPIRLNKFSSLSVHLGSYPSKKDDLETLGYIMVYFLKGGKLWDNFKEKGPALVKAIEKVKLNLTPEVFCEGLPREMVEYFTYIRAAKANDKTDYVKLNDLLRSMVKAANPGKIVRYDWTERAIKHLEQQRKEQSNQQTNTPTDAVTESDNKNLPLGAIDLDKDENFVMRDDLSVGDDDDESNIEESYTREILTNVDALPQSIQRLQNGFTSYFIRDMRSPSPGKKISFSNGESQPS